MATPGGKVSLIQGVSFADGIVSIGNKDTRSDASNSVVIGNDSYILALPAESGTVVIGFGSVSAFSPAAIVMGTNATTVSNPAIVILGSRSSAASLPTTPDNHSSVIVGYQCLCENGSFDSVVLGYQARSSGSPGSAVIGTDAEIDERHDSVGEGIRSLVVGHQAVSNSSSGFTFGAMVIGYQAEALGGPGDEDGIHSIVIGSQASSTALSQYSVVVGSQSYSNSPYAVVIGKAAQVIDLATDSIAIGPSTTVGSSCSECIVVGYTSSIQGTGFGAASTRAIAIGYNALCSNGSDDAIVLGIQSSAQESPDAIAVGYGAGVFAGNNTGIAIGQLAQANSHTLFDPQNVVIGNEAYSSGSAIVIGPLDSISTSCDGGEGIVIGPNSHFDALAIILGIFSYAEGGLYTTHIGSFNQNLFPGYSFSLVAGPGNIVNNPVPLGTVTCVGTANNLTNSSDGSVVFGQGNAVSFALQSVTLGRLNQLTAGATSIVFGNDNVIDDVVTNSIIIGTDNEVSSSHSITMGFGATNTVDNTMVVGDNTTGSPVKTMAIHGYNGGAIFTLFVTDTPAADNMTGLTVAYNTGAGVVNKDVYISAAPPPGAIILYMIP